MGNIIHQLKIRMAQHVPVFILSHASLAPGHSQALETAIGEHLLSSLTFGSGYSADFFSVLHRAREKRYINIFEVVVINTSHPNLCRQRELNHKMTIFGVSLFGFKQLYIFSFPLPFVSFNSFARRFDSFQ